MSTLKIGQSASFELAAGQKISITAATGATGYAVRYTGSTETGTVSLASGESATLGEYFLPQNILVACVAGTLTYEVTQSTDVIQSGPLFRLGGNVVVSSCDGAPEDAAQAAVTINPTGDDNALVYTAVQYGARGNLISIAYVNPSANNAALAVTVSGQAISVSLATNGGGSITSTAAQVLAAIEAHPVASTMVTVADAADNDGSGVVTAIAADFLEGGEGTLIGVAGPGSLVIDYDNGDIYRNSGTLAAPAWAQLADVA
jgi:hypothetical protein